MSRSLQASIHSALLLLASLFCVMTTAVCVAGPAPLPNPNFSSLLANGTVQAVALQSDGGVILGGTFTSVNNVPRQNIARLKPDGSLDSSWDPSADNYVDALAIDASGAIYVGGGFCNVGGQARCRIAKLSGTGTGVADASWNPSPNNLVRAITVDAGGAVYVGGDFTTIAGQNRNRIAKLSGASSGAADANWNPSANGSVTILALDGSGAVYAAGYFSNIGGQSRNNLAKLSDTVTGAADAAWNPTPNSYVYSLALDTSGNIYAGGPFTAIGGQTRYFIAKLSGSGTGAADATWNPGANNTVENVVIDGNGTGYVGGYFNSVGGQPHSGLAKVSSAGVVDSTWTPSDDATTSALAVDSNGVVYSGGSFAAIDGQARLGFAKLAADGSLTAVKADTRLQGSVAAMVAQPGGGMIVGGHFSEVNGVSRGNILRLNPDGSLDAIWNPSADRDVVTLAVDANGAVYAAGNFNNFGGQSRHYLAKVSGSGVGAVDTTWDPSANSQVLAIAVDSSGAVYASGYFSGIGGQTRQGIAKLSGTSSGAADATWDPSPSGYVYSLAVDGADAVYAGGNFTTIGGLSRKNFAKLSNTGTGSADAIWDPSPDNIVNAVSLDGSGAIYAGGCFLNIGGQARSRIAKLGNTGTGAADAFWNPSANNCVASLTTNSNGDVYAGGSFTNIGGQSRAYVAKLSGSGAGSADAYWNPSPGSAVATLAFSDSATLYIGGKFVAVDKQPRAGIAAVPSSVAPPPGKSTATGSLHYARRLHTATLLLDGRVLIAGGQNDALSPATINVPIAEVYDPASGLFTDVGTLNQGRGRRSATANLLASGKVLISGGYDDTSGILNTAELFDPTTNQFSYTGSMSGARELHASATLTDGRVLVAGGYPSSMEAELYDPATGQFTSTGMLKLSRYYDRAISLANGKVLVTGDAVSGLTNELYDPASGTFAYTSSFVQPISSGGFAMLSKGRVLAAGGYYNGVYSATAQIYDPATGQFALTGSMSEARNGFGLISMTNGQQLVCGGLYGSASAEIYDELAGQFTATVNMMSARGDHTATALKNGRVLIVGGTSNSGAVELVTAELYTPEVVFRGSFE